MLNRPSKLYGSTFPFFWVLVALAMLWSFFPIFWVLLNSVRPPSLMFAFPPKLIFSPILSNFQELFIKFPAFLEGFQASVFITTIASLATVLLSSMAAYSLSRFDFLFKRELSFSLIAIRLVPPIAITVPLFPLFHQMRLLDTFFGLGLLYVVFRVSFSTLLMKGFIDKVPLSQDESAQIDGASSPMIFMRIILPQVLPGLAATLIYNFILNWNDFILAFIFTRANAVTAPIRLKEMLGGVYGVEWGPLFAATALMLLPTLILVWLIQRFLLEGFSVNTDIT